VVEDADEGEGGAEGISWMKEGYHPDHAEGKSYTLDDCNYKWDPDLPTVEAAEHTLKMFPGIPTEPDKLPCEPKFSTDLGWLAATNKDGQSMFSDSSQPRWSRMQTKADGDEERAKIATAGLEHGEAKEAGHLLWIEEMERNMQVLEVPDMEAEAQRDLNMWGGKVPKDKKWHEFKTRQAQKYMLRREKVHLAHAELERKSGLHHKSHANVLSAKVAPVEQALEALEEQIEAIQEA